MIEMLHIFHFSLFIFSPITCNVNVFVLLKEVYQYVQIQRCKYTICYIPFNADAYILLHI
jgi:hypothetical protein